MHVSPSTRPRIALGPEWYAVSDVYGAWHAGWLFTVLIVLVGLLPGITARGWYAAYLAIVPLIGAYAYKLTIVMHECCHRTLFASRGLNHGVGVLCGGVLGSGFDVYCDVHWGHHRHCGTEKDGGENDYLSLQGAPPRTLVLHLLEPLTGVTFLEILKLSLTKSSAGAERTAAAEDAVRHRRSPAFQLAVVVAVQAAIAWLATGGLRYPWLVVVFPLSAATFGLFFSRTRAFCEHVSYTRGPAECFTRSHEPNGFDRVFFYTLNMNLHVEHHWFPQVPARHLPRLRSLLKQGGYLTDEMTSTSIVATVAGRFQEARARLSRA